MLDDKDYCNYETCVALKELGYNGTVGECSHFGAFYMNGKEIFYDRFYNSELKENECLRVPLYLAQKWLREEKNIDISVTISPFEYFATIREFVFWQGEYSWEKTIHPNGGKTYEEALLEGIKEAVKILKGK